MIPPLASWRMLPQWWWLEAGRRIAAALARRAMAIDLQDGVRCLYRDRQGQWQPRAQVPRRGAVHVLLPDTLIRRVTLTMQANAAAHLHGLAGLEIEEHFPFASDQCFHAARIIANDAAAGTIQVEITACPRHRVTPLLEQVRSLGLQPTALTIAGDTVVIPVEGEDGKSADHRRRLLTWLMLLACLWSSPFAIITGWQEWLALRMADQATAAEAARAMAARLAPARNAMNMAGTLPPVAPVLNALAQHFPDTAWVTAIDMADGRISVTGRTKSDLSGVAGLASIPGLTGVEIHQADGAFTLTARMAVHDAD
jgi:hypothetical protein